MSEYTPETAILEAVIRLLLADPGIQSLVEDRVFDEPPESSAFPYIHLEAMNSRRMEAGCGSVMTVTMRFFAVSGNEFGRQRAWLVANAMFNVLEDAEPKLVEGFRRQGPIMHQMSANVLDPEVVKAVAVDIVCGVSASLPTQG
jgi:hypothetical protein